MMKFFVLGFFLVHSAWAGEFDCRIAENYSMVEKVKITATEDQRLLVRSDESYVLYLNLFKAGEIELEAFLPDAEMRIYSKGNLEKSSVRLTSWQRELLLEFECANSPVK